MQRRHGVHRSMLVALSLVAVMWASAGDDCDPDPVCDPEGCGGAHAYCDEGECRCDAGYANCDGDWADGCEQDLLSDPAHCGGCGLDCGLAAECVDGDCACNTGPRANCNDDWADGCEAHLLNDDDSCGACGQVCPANSGCSDAECRCQAGWADCDWPRTSFTLIGNADGCECPLSAGWVCDQRLELRCCQPNPGEPCAGHGDCCGNTLLCVGGTCQPGFGLY